MHRRHKRFAGQARAIHEIVLPVLDPDFLQGRPSFHRGRFRASRSRRGTRATSSKAISACRLMLSLFMRPQSHQRRES